MHRLSDSWLDAREKNRIPFSPLGPKDADIQFQRGRG